MAKNEKTSDLEDNDPRPPGPKPPITKARSAHDPHALVDNADSTPDGYPVDVWQDVPTSQVPSPPELRAGRDLDNTEHEKQSSVYKSFYTRFGTSYTTGETYLKSVDGVMRTLPVKKFIRFDNNTFVAKTKEEAEACDKIIADAEAAGQRSPFVKVDEYAKLRAQEPQEVVLTINGVVQRVPMDALKESFLMEHNTHNPAQQLKRS